MGRAMVRREREKGIVQRKRKRYNEEIERIKFSAEGETKKKIVWREGDKRNDLEAIFYQF